MNKLMLPAAALLALSLTACPTSPGGDAALSAVSGQIVNWPAGKTGTVSAVANATAIGTKATINTTGNFSLSLPSEAEIKPFLTSSGTATPCSGVTATPNVLGASTSFGVFNSTQTSVGNLGQALSDPNTLGLTTQTAIIYLYLASSWTATGSCTSGSLTQSYSVQGKPGWNAITASITPGNISYSSGPVPANLKWFFVGNLNQLNAEQFQFNRFFSR